MLKSPLSLALIFGITCALVPVSVAANPLEAVVDSIVDGDTVTLNQGGRAIAAQLACIDTPDWINGQPQTNAQGSKDYLTSLIPVGSSVQYYDVGRANNQTLVVIFSQRQNINLQMVAAGQARLHSSYGRTCRNSAEALASAETSARSQGLGVWGR
ncbi:MAG: thermonuclease family protein [Coleofasciculaceae cyanobacterium SM2_1_6]|nr:thermonuclease family protein [Coleofasciculaceae cyanobacterium SM2_1_6]